MRIQQTRSLIRTTRRQRSIMETLGFRRIGHIRTVSDHPSIKGMVVKVAHLIKVLPEEHHETQSN